MVGSSHGPSKHSEWFAKTQFILDNLKDKDAKVHLLYKSSDVEKDETINSIINYFSNSSERINKLDVEEGKNLTELCNYIEKEAEDIEEYIA